MDSTDFLPTLLEAAGVTLPADLKLDGRSFLPQLRGEKGQPREWIYSWYSPRQGADLTVREFAFNQRFKLYRTGEFFDLTKDAEEKQPLKASPLKGEAAAAAKLLQGALDQFKDARPAGSIARERKPPKARRRHARTTHRDHAPHSGSGPSPTQRRALPELILPTAANPGCSAHRLVFFCVCTASIEA